MTRKYYRAKFYTDDGACFQRITYAWNSAIRATEEMARTYARSAGTVLEGDRAVREGGIYRRTWTDGRVTGVAMVREVESNA